MELHISSLNSILVTNKVFHNFLQSQQQTEQIICKYRLQLKYTLDYLRKYYCKNSLGKDIGLDQLTSVVNNTKSVLLWFFLKKTVLRSWFHVRKQKIGVQTCQSALSQHWRAQRWNGRSSLHRGQETHTPQPVPTPQIQPGGSTTSSTTQCRVLGWTCSLTLPRCELLVTAPAAGLEPVQAGDKKVQHPIPNPLSHESPKSLIVWKPDAMPGTIGTDNPPRLPWFRCIH